MEQSEGRFVESIVDVLTGEKLCTDVSHAVIGASSNFQVLSTLPVSSSMAVLEFGSAPNHRSQMIPVGVLQIVWSINTSILREKKMRRRMSFQKWF